MPGYDCSAHVGWLFTELPLAERIAAAVRCGFAAVEHPAPYAVPATELAGWLASAGARYVQLGMRSGDASQGEKGLAIFPERRDEVRASVAEALDYAEAVGARMVHLMAGVLGPEQRAPHHWDCYVEQLAYAAAEARPRGITVIVEPMSRAAVPDYFVATPAEAARAIAEAGGDGLGLLLDVFHTASEGLDVSQEIATHAALLAHVHVAGVPGRHEPDTGTLDLDGLEHALREAGYDGVLGCEYAPVGTTEAGLGWLRRRAASAPARA